MLPFERADMLEVLGNLLDNAWKWAGSRVLVTIDEAPAEWRLRVADDGPGIDVPDDREQALARGYRLDESVAGQGLGLAIAADIVATYRGSLRLDHSPLGGLEVHVQLPKPQGRNY
jgi:signal transduction histidine kinase